MRATKEACRHAITRLDLLKQAVEDAEVDIGQLAIMPYFDYLSEFLACTEKRLPSENAVNKDKRRKRR